MKYIISLIVVIVAIVLFSAFVHLILALLIPAIIVGLVGVAAYRIGKIEGRHEAKIIEPNPGTAQLLQNK